MPYDPELNARLADMLAAHPAMEEKKMFGGIGWLLCGNMCVGVYKEYLILRCGQPLADKVLANEFAKPMDITGKVMKGWVMVAPEGFEGEQELRELVEGAISFVATLPPKEK